jgi:hypothetical protein
LLQSTRGKAAGTLALPFEDVRNKECCSTSLGSVSTQITTVLIRNHPSINTVHRHFKASPSARCFSPADVILKNIDILIKVFLTDISCTDLLITIRLSFVWGTR